MPASNSSIFLQLVKQSDWMTTVVFIFLFCMSLFSWTALFYKLIVWKVKNKQMDRMIKELQEAKTIGQSVQLSSLFHDSFGGYFLSKLLSQFKKIKLSGSVASHEHMTDRQWQMFEGSVDSLIDETLAKESAWATVVGACMTIAPLLGLYGTVWGLVISFMDIGKQQSADIVTVAPGISMALATTVAGLLVAIPAAVIYYILQMKLRTVEARLLGITERVLLLIGREEGSQN